MSSHPGFRHPPLLAAEELRRRLTPAVSAAERDAADVAEEFPAAEVAVLDDYGLARHYVPAEYGGLLRDYESAAALMRGVAGHDLTVAIAHGKTYLGSVCTWVAGTAEQAHRVAALVSAGVPVSWGLTEREHGSDLVAGELTATADGNTFRLDGEKYLINNATRGGLATVLARTAPEGGPRGFDVFLVERSRLAEGTYTPLPKVATIGIRGADISGFTLRAAQVDTTDRIGAPGTGLETVLRALQLTRTLCSALSLGAGDHGLAEAVAFAGERELYGRRLAALPAAARTLTDCYADHLLNEALATVAARAIHTMTGELAALSVAVKYLVPVRTEALLARLRRLLGARAWLRDVRGGVIAQGTGRFQKIERDHRIVSLFDGNTVVNLNSLVSQFATLARGHRAVREPPPGLAVAADLAAPLPAVNYGALRLVPTRGIGLLHNLAPASAQLAELAGADPLLGPVAAAVRRLTERTETLLAEIGTQPIVPPDVPPYAFALARRLAAAVAAAAAVALWLGSHRYFVDGTDEPGSAAPLWRHGRWLLAVLDRVLGQESTVEDEVLDETHAVLGTVLAGQVAAGAMPSLLSLGSVA
ncbi:acyl-CoA dehydrogenase family protein [Saccharomonospora sp. NPDC046836]|uniref:acyl-CoA dehydrogenase family protein n=1 Tax=Saccharomonospora sp. NPDC046836 TaxID=3156921 RepID=UPI0033E81442